MPHLLVDKRFLETDVIICCTGSGPNGKEISIKKDGVEVDIEQITSVYRARVIPGIPRLIFTGYHSFIAGIVNTLVQGAWIKKYIEANLSEAELQKQQANYDYPFFTKAPLFSSEKPLATNYYFGIEQFIQGKDLDEQQFKEWLVACYTNTDSACVPFKFLC